MRDEKEVKAKLQQVESDERLSYPTATVDINAPLALEQQALESWRAALRWVLEIVKGKAEPEAPKVDKTEALEMDLGDRMTILSFASKSLELLEARKPKINPVDFQQWEALGHQAHIVLARLDKEWPAMIPLPHDGISWSKRKNKNG